MACRTSRATMLAVFVLSALAMLAAASSAHAAALAPDAVGLLGCRAVHIAPTCGTDGFGATTGSDYTSIVATPDDKYVYASTNTVGGGTDGTQQIQAYAVTGHGSLSPLGCISAGAGCVEIPELRGDGVTDMALSPDGAYLYALAANTASTTEGRLLVFIRNTSNGTLSQGPSQCSYDVDGGSGGAIGCSALVAQAEIGTPLSMAMSPDGRYLYVTTRVQGTVSVFARSQVNGSLTYVSCLGLVSGGSHCPIAAMNPSNTSAIGDTYSVGGLTDVVVTPDGSELIVTGNGGAMVGIERNPSTGALTPVVKSCLVSEAGSGGCTGSVDGIYNLQGVAVSSDGASVYTSAIGSVSGSNAVSRLARVAATGALTPVSCYAAVPSGATKSSTCTQLTTLKNPIRIGISADGSTVLVDEDAGVHAFTRASSGAMTPAGCAAIGVSGCTELGSFGTSKALATTSAADHFYVGATRSGGPALHTFSLGRAPRCVVSTLIAVAFRSAATVPSGLCTDANGDPLTYSVASAPTRGTAAAVNDGSASATYLASSSANGGADSFMVGASDGAASALLPVSVTIGGAPDLVTTTWLTSIGSVVANRPATLAVRVTNAGMAPATNVQVSASGSSLTAVNISSTAAACSGSACTVGVIGPGDVVDLVVTVTPTTTGALQFVATATPAEVDANSADNSSTMALQVAAPNVLVIDNHMATSSISIASYRTRVLAARCGASLLATRVCTARRTAALRIGGRVKPLRSNAASCVVRVAVQRRRSGIWRPVGVRGHAETTCAAASGAWSLTYPARTLPTGSLRIRATVSGNLAASAATSRWLYLRIVR